MCLSATLPVVYNLIFNVLFRNGDVEFGKQTLNFSRTYAKFLLRFYQNYSIWIRCLMVKCDLQITNKQIFYYGEVTLK